MLGHPRRAETQTRETSRTALYWQVQALVSSSTDRISEPRPARPLPIDLDSVTMTGTRTQTGGVLSHSDAPAARTAGTSNSLSISPAGPRTARARVPVTAGSQGGSGSRSTEPE